ncbi:MAG: DUF4221 family protein [Bacteroidales bacterium]|nr:DUF4221 family protein [Bacteroidales bacterium]
MKAVLSSIAIIIFFFFSCNTEIVKENTNVNIEYRIGSRIHIAKDSSILDYYPIHQIFERDSFWGLICFNNHSHNLEFFNCNTGLVDIHLILDERGFDIPPGFNDFYFHNFDSIFFSYDEYKLIRLNSRTKEIQYYNLQNKILARCKPVMGFSLDFIPEKQVIQFSAPFYQELFHRKYYKSPLVGNFNILTDSLDNRFGYHPKIYHTKKMKYPIMQMPSKTIVGGCVALSFSPEDNLYFYHKIDGNLIAKVDCSSNYINFPIKPISKTAEFQIGIDYLIETPFYYKIFFDKKNQRIYRLVKHGQNLKKENGQLNARWDGPWSIIIMNLKYEIIGEAVFPKEVFNYKFSFVSLEGFCVAYKSPDLGDSQTFALIEFDIPKK